MLLSSALLQDGEEGGVADVWGTLGKVGPPPTQQPGQSQQPRQLPAQPRPRRRTAPRAEGVQCHRCLLAQNLRPVALEQRGIDATLICDSAAAQVMREGRVQAVITGADRIAANGDTANKIGTFSVATLARAFGIPFYVAAPLTTFDLSIASGSEIPIEQRATDEVTNGFGQQTAPTGAAVYNPAFDVTPAELIAAIISDRGVVRPVNSAAVRAMIDS